MLLLVPILLIAVLGIRMLIDAPPPDLSDLEFHPRQVPDADNFYLALRDWSSTHAATPVITTELAERFPPIPPTPEEAQENRWNKETDADRLRSQLCEGRAWTPALQETLRPSLAPAWEDFQRIMQRPDCQAPQVHSLDDPYLLSEVRPAWSILLITAWDQFYQDKQNEAVDTLLAGWNAALRIRDSRSVMINYLIGIASEARTRDAAISIAMHPSARRATIDRLLNGIRQLPLDTDATPDLGADSLRHEISLVLNGIRAMTPARLEQNLHAQNLLRPDPPALIRKLARIAFPFVYQPNRTQTIAAIHLRNTLRKMEHPGLTLSDMQDDNFRYVDFVERYSAPWWDFRNWAGIRILNTVMPTLDNIPELRLLVRSRNSMAQTGLALRLYHFDHGALPETLDALVPAYLPAVPLDYIDHHPIRYSATFRTVWTIGRTNLQITVPDQKPKSGEFILSLDFAKPPPHINPQ
ncbi:hypothetical protein [Geminisphaera colitermitum]|uniref:hypothetical protein n=1 Tax=Geminisphaera colitermitum TaxID=1148786 RepID=UPI0012FEFC39|nr:hypothetical protein [Geminisphaera colitermitum]